MKTLLLLLFTSCAFAQDCVYANLSKQLDFTVKAKRFESGSGLDSVDVDVTVVVKKGGMKSNMHFGSRSFDNDSYAKCGNVRSYATGVNKDKEAVGNDYGDLVVADLNFDGLDDLAIKRQQGGNGGPLYNFYFQDKNWKFIKNDFLSTSMAYFPYKILEDKKMLVARVRLNTYESEDIYYQYTAPPAGDGWRKLKRE